MINILILAANPHCDLDLEYEIKKIENVLSESRFKNQFKLVKKSSMTASKLQEVLLRFKPQIIHFSGHGSEKGCLVFEQEEDEQEGEQEREVPPAALTNLFEIVNRSGQVTHCVVLNACYSKRQAEAISKHVPCVIGMNDAIYDHAAIKFATSFYRALSYGQSIKDAYDLGRNELDLQNVPGSSIIDLLNETNVLPSEIFLVNEDEIPSDISSESNLERHIHILLENPNFKGRSVDKITKTYDITKPDAVRILRKLNAARIVSDKNEKNPEGEYWGIISHVIRVHFARSTLTYINYKYLLGDFKDKSDKKFQKRFDQVLGSVCSQSRTNKKLWKLK